MNTPKSVFTGGHGMGELIKCFRGKICGDGRNSVLSAYLVRYAIYTPMKTANTQTKRMYKKIRILFSLYIITPSFPIFISSSHPYSEGNVKL